MGHTAEVNRSKLLVIGVVATIVVLALLGALWRRDLRCAGFAGPGIDDDELPPPAPAGAVRVAHFTLRNFPLDERPEIPGLGYSRRTNICDMETVLGGLGAQIIGFAEVCDTRRFPPILRRSSGSRPMHVLFSEHGGRAGQHLAIAWDGDAFELVEGPIEITEVAVSWDLRPGLAVRLRSTFRPTLDLTVIEVHLDAGRDDVDRRSEQVRALALWIGDWTASTGDRDIVLLGDFNTVGGPGLTAEDELRQIDRALAAVGLRRLANATGCSQYWEGPGVADGIFTASLLDLVYLSGLDADGPARSWLHCERAGCGDLASRPGGEDGTFFDVSDHCPVTFEIARSGGGA